MLSGAPLRPERNLCHILLPGRDARCTELRVSVHIVQSYQAVTLQCQGCVGLRYRPKFIGRRGNVLQQGAGFFAVLHRECAFHEYLEDAEAVIAGVVEVEGYVVR